MIAEAKVMDLRNERRRAAVRPPQTESETAALALMRKRWRPHDPMRLRFEQQCVTNVAFLVGFQYLTWDPGQRQLVYAQTPSLRWRARAMHNLIRPYVELDVGTVGTFTPAYRCRPKNNDYENHEAARANSDLLAHYWDQQKMPAKKYDMLYWAKVVGSAFLFGRWDKTLGAQVADDEMAQGSDGQQIRVASREFEGDILWTVESPLTVYFDTCATEWEDVRWVIHARARPREWLEEHYPEKSAYVPDGITDDGLINRQRFALDFAGPSAILGDFHQGDARENWVLVKEYWERASLDYPRGRYFVECNGILIDGPRDNPTPKGLLPFVIVRDALVPGRIWGQCNVDNLLTMQRSLNRFISKKEEHIVLTANAKILEHVTNELPASAWMTEIGEVVKWAGQTEPRYLVPPPMPPETDTEINRLEHHFDLVTSQYGPARGQYPGKVSGKAINVLIEQNTQNKTPMIERLAESLKEWGTLTLELAQEYVKEPRVIKIIGRGQSFAVKDFEGQDIRDNTEVSIDIESMIPKSRTMALDMIQTLTQMGWLQPQNPQHQARVWKSLSMDDDAPLTEDPKADIRVAQAENRLAMMGIPPPPASFLEDQDLHFLIHAEQTKQDDFKSASPQIQKILMDHIQTHIDAATPRVGSTQPAQQEESYIGGDQGGGAPSFAPQQGNPPPQSAPAAAAYQ